MAIIKVLNGAFTRVVVKDGSTTITFDAFSNRPTFEMESSIEQYLYDVHMTREDAKVFLEACLKILEDTEDCEGNYE